MRLLFFLTLALSAQEALTNEGVVKLIKAGLSEDLVINAIAAQPGSFTLGADDLVALKEGGISEKIIRAMMDKGKPAKPAGESTPAPDLATVPAALEALPAGSVYYKRDTGYFELLTEEIRWKTSGALKSFASAGIIRKDLGGTLAGPSSRNFLRNPMDVVLVPQPGMSINNFILLPMKQDGKEGEREFKVGAINAKSGVAKGAIAFGVVKVGPNHFRMVFTTPLGPGEYAILPVLPAGSGPSTKMYTFRVLI